MEREIGWLTWHLVKYIYTLACLLTPAIDHWRLQQWAALHCYSHDTTVPHILILPSLLRLLSLLVCHHLFILLLFISVFTPLFIYYWLIHWAALQLILFISVGLRQSWITSIKLAFLVAEIIESLISLLLNQRSNPFLSLSDLTRIYKKLWNTASIFLFSSLSLCFFLPFCIDSS